MAASLGEEEDRYIRSINLPEEDGSVTEYTLRYLFRTKRGVNWMRSVDYRDIRQLMAMANMATECRWGPKNFKLAMDLAQKHYDFVEGNIDPDFHYFLNYQNGYTKLAGYLTDATGEEYWFDDERQRPCSKAEVAELRRVWNENVPSLFEGFCDFDRACLAMCGKTEDLVPGFMAQMRITNKSAASKRQVPVATPSGPCAPSTDNTKILRDVLGFNAMERSSDDKSKEEVE